MGVMVRSPPMDFAYTDEDEAFRDELVGWLDEHLPKFLAEWSEDERRHRDDADSASPAAAAGSCRRWSAAGPGSAR